MDRDMVMNMHTHTHTDRQTDRHTQPHTHTKRGIYKYGIPSPLHYNTLASTNSGYGDLLFAHTPSRRLALLYSDPVPDSLQGR